MKAQEESRSLRSTISIGLLVCFTSFMAFNAISMGNPLLAILMLIGGGVLAVAALRNRSIPLQDSLFSAPADYVYEELHKKFPGQLSITAEKIHWQPTKYSAKRGHTQIEIERDDLHIANLAKGPGLADVFLHLHLNNGESIRFLTSRYKHLKKALEVCSGMQNK